MNSLTPPSYQTQDLKLRSDLYHSGIENFLSFSSLVLYKVKNLILCFDFLGSIIIFIIDCKELTNSTSQVPYIIYGLFLTNTKRPRNNDNNNYIELSVTPYKCLNKSGRLLGYSSSMRIKGVECLLL